MASGAAEGEIDVGLVGTEVVVLLALVVLLAIVVVLQLRELRRRAAAERNRPRPPREGDIMMVCGPGLVTDEVSPVSQPLLGYRAETLRGTAVARLVHPDDLSPLTAFLDDPGAHPGPMAVRLRHQDGRWIWMLAADASRHRHPGSIELYPRDITERIRAEEWIAAQRELADVVLEMASDAFIATDERGRVVDWNRAAESVLGWPRDEVLGRNAVELLVPDRMRPLYESRIGELWQAHPVRVDEPTDAVLLRRDGSELPVEVTAWTVQLGRTRQLSVLARDRTARTQVEQALREARERALEASRLKSEFLATMSHEIRTPMNGVIGLSGLLLETGLDATQRRYAEGIRTAGDALLDVINDILDFSKVEAGKLTLAEVDFDLRQLVEDVVEVVAEPSRSKGLELFGYVQPGVPVALHGDPGRLRQVLLNLTGNAVKFTERGEVVVRAERVERAGPDIVIRFEVTDTGIGIPAEHRERLFEAFSQGDASTTRRFGGTGLGLAISRQLIELMGGRIGVTSEPGRGSTFWTEVPLRRQQNGASTQRYRRDLIGLRVLVVDNNATNRLILEEQMQAWRMAPTTVDSGTAALAELREANREGRGYDLAVLDMYMPEMDGLELARRIRSDPDIASVYLILLTSGGSADLTGARAAGISACLTKPVHQSELFDALARVLTDTDTEPAPAPSTVEEPVPTARRRVLLAEDNDINQQVAVAILERMDLDVDIAGNGQEALDLAGGHQYDIVLMDCQMPVMDGYTATEELRRRGSRTPVIALTASARTEDRERSLEAGMDDHLAKPIRPEQLREMLDRWVAHSSTVDTPVSRAGPGDGPVRAAVSARLDELRGVDPQTGTGLVRTLVDSFLDRAPAAVSAITADLERGDAEAAGAQAHKLQGMAGNLGATEVADVSGAISHDSRAGDLDPALVARLREELDAALAALRDVRSTL